MKSYTKIFFVCAIILFFVSMVIAFDWPQSVAGTSEINKSFGELQGDIFNTSLIFSKAEDVQSTEAGQLMAILGQSSREMGWAPTTLGNAVILAHENNLLTVYGNLQDIDVDANASFIAKNSVLGTGGNSAWQQGYAGLHFQAIDTEKDMIINPRILLPQIPEEKKISITHITAINKQGEVFDLYNNMTLPATTYSFYRAIEQNTGSPYITSVAINGAEVEAITYDVLVHKRNVLTVDGKNFYAASEIYPEKDRQFLTTVSLSPGKNTFTLRVKDINGKETTLTYTIYAR